MPKAKKEDKVKKVAVTKKVVKKEPKAAPKKDSPEKKITEDSRPVVHDSVKAAVSEPVEVKTKTKLTREISYTEATGRRKNAVARIRLTSGDGNLIVNDVSAWDYFKDQFLAHQILEQPFAVVEQKSKYNAIIKVNGGGKMAQLGAIVHGLSRALNKLNPDQHTLLKRAGLLTRDSRMKERKKFGLLGARTRKPSPKR